MMACNTLLLLSSLIIAAVTQAAGGQAGGCPLTYDPVVDPTSGLPFYNDCLARLQLPSETKLVRRSTLEAAATTARRQLRGASEPALEPSAQDYMRLMPPPAAPNAVAGDVDFETVTMFAVEGFVYVGRPGFLLGSPSAQTGEPKARDEAAPTTVDGSRVSLRVTYPHGDMYMKIWSRDELQRLASTSTDAAALGDASPPDGSAEYDNEGAGAASSVGSAAAAASTGSRHSLSRRLLDNDNGNNGNGNGNGKGNGNGNDGNGKSGAGGNGKNSTGSGNGKGSDNDAGWGKGWGSDGSNKTTANRTEVTTVAYPYSAASYVNLLRGNVSTWCSGSLVGSTGRLVLTAAHCLYQYDTLSAAGVGYYQSFYVSPGAYRKNTTLMTPYTRISAGVAEVMAQWMLKGNFDFDIGFLRLTAHTTAPGTLGIANATCGQKPYNLTTAGYPGDKGFNGSMWKQSFNATADQCASGAQKGLTFKYAFGQDGSAMWTSNNVVRFLMTGSYAVPINPTYYKWLLDYTSRNILNLPRYYLAAGVAPNVALFIACNPATRTCAGSSNRLAATPFMLYPITNSRRYAIATPGATAGSMLCLTAADVTLGSTVNLSPCNQNQQFKFNATALWDYVPAPISTLARLDTGMLLKTTGDGQSLASGSTSCAGTSDCSWKLLAVI